MARLVAPPDQRRPDVAAGGAAGICPHTSPARRPRRRRIDTAHRPASRTLDQGALRRSRADRYSGRPAAEWREGPARPAAARRPVRGRRAAPSGSRRIRAQCRDPARPADSRRTVLPRAHRARAGAAGSPLARPRVRRFAHSRRDRQLVRGPGRPRVPHPGGSRAARTARRVDGCRRRVARAARAARRHRGSPRPGRGWPGFGKLARSSLSPIRGPNRRSSRCFVLPCTMAVSRRRSFSTGSGATGSTCTGRGTGSCWKPTAGGSTPTTNCGPNGNAKRAYEPGTIGSSGSSGPMSCRTGRQRAPGCGPAWPGRARFPPKIVEFRARIRRSGAGRQISSGFSGRRRCGGR